MTLRERNEALKNGALNLRDELHKRLQSAEEHADLKAFVRLLPERAAGKVEQIEKMIRGGKAPGPLAGTIIAIKDNLNIAGEVSTCGSRILHNFRSPYSATVIERLEEADAVIIGKTNQDEFAMGSSNENSFFGAVKNPHNPERVPGGSSGGSAVAVAAGIADAALGSDTGGSIRQPASFCGLVGLKPSYGRISRYGLIAYASSLDQIGPLTHSVEDSAFLMNLLAGYDERDSTSVNVPVPDFTQALQHDVKGLRIGLPDQYFAEGLDEEIRTGIMYAGDQLEQAGAEVKRLQLPMTEYGIATYYILATAEASSNLARYDGVRFGWRGSGSEDLADMYGSTRSSGFGQEVQRRIILGTYVLSAGYYDAYYAKAQKVRRLIKNEFDEAFQSVDVLITPTTPTTAFRIGEKVDDPLTMYLSDIYTVTANLAGICGLNVPAGRDKDNMPFGMQLLANRFEEEKLFTVGSFIEKNGATK